ncbi:MAG: hypothetical protein Q7R93_01040 [bacterium]|nr:hypothetical protein [bacterium]
MHNLILTEKELWRLFRPKLICNLSRLLPYTTDAERDTAERAIRQEFKRNAFEAGGIAVIIDEPIFFKNGTREIFLSAQVYTGESR